MAAMGAVAARTAAAVAMLAAVLPVACAAPAEPAGDKMEQAVLFSGLAGRVVRGGEPVAGARLVRRWDFAQDRVQGQDEAITDASGQFRLPPVLHAYRKPRLLAQQFVVSQLIQVKADGREWEAWVSSKLDSAAGTERAKGPVAGTDPDQPLAVLIDLDAPLALRGGVAGRTFFTDAGRTVQP
jgi:hypothetical protein